MGSLLRHAFLRAFETSYEKMRLFIIEYTANSHGIIADSCISNVTKIGCIILVPSQFKCYLNASFLIRITPPWFIVVRGLAQTPQTII